MTVDENAWGREIIAKALRYVNHEWYAMDKNVLHGLDADGRFVDTPDVTWSGEEFDCGWWKPNQVNRGIPYSWGNASTIAEFNQGILEGKYAGNVPEDKKRLGSHMCVGVDCSGLLTVCWELPRKIATRDIPDVATKLDSLDEIRQGDVFAKSWSHVMLFKEFADKDKTVATIIDATRSIGRVSQRNVVVEELFAEGYVIYRRK